MLRMKPCSTKMSYLHAFILLYILDGHFTAGNLSNDLEYFELLKESDIHSVSRRDVHMRPEKDLTFQILGRQFDVHLLSKRGLFTHDFHAYSVNNDGKKVSLDISEDEFFVGTVKGDNNSDVHAFWEHGAMTATIATDNELYIIEPSWRHIESEEYSMIAYKGSDIKGSFDKKYPNGVGPKFCGSIYAEEEGVIPDEVFRKANNTGSQRRKRAATALNTCSLLVVADFRYFKNIGNNASFDTALHLIGMIERIDAIYRATVWGQASSLSNLGFEIKEILIHEAPTPVSAGEVHYNMDRATWGTTDLLTTFSSNQDNQKFCLAHLFTSQAFDTNVLGLAYIASPKTGAAGGLCSPLRTKNGVRMSYNTGWSSAMNGKGKTILTRQADLVTSHELGHNWGSEHDTDNSECSPSSLFGDGKYIMYPYSVSGYDSNNDLFSTCSKTFVKAVLDTKAASCLTENTGFTGLCGNGKLDADEECDGGILSRIGSDPCCDTQCRLKGSATCSHVNYDCCRNCQIAPISTLCAGGDDTSCYGTSFCDGSSLLCPEPVNKADTTPCLDNGMCFAGVCKAFCEARNMISCICNDLASSCLRCCRADNASSTCQPHSSNMDLPDARPCLSGFCESGVCQKAVRDIVERFFDLIESITFDAVVEFVKSNIVGCILIASLVFWIPGSCYFSSQDRKHRRADEERQKFFDTRKRTFMVDEDFRDMNIMKVKLSSVSAFKAEKSNKPVISYK